MTDLAALKASVTDLTARVKNATSVEASVAALVQAMVQQNKDLAAQLASMDAGSITQADIDDLKQQVSDSATALDEGTAALAKAAAFDPTNPNPESGGVLRGGAKYPGNQAGAGNQGGIVGRPGVGSAATADPDLGGGERSDGGPKQFIGNPTGPAGSDNPNQPRRDQRGDATPGTVQPNPANPVPLPNKAKPLGGTTPDEREADANAAAKAAAADPAGVPAGNPS